MGSLRMSIRCSIPICVALFLIGAYPNPISFEGRCIDSVGKLGIRPMAFLAALLSILSIVESCVSVKITRWVAWYLDLSNWSMTSCFLLGDSRLLVSIRASFLTSVVMCLKWSLKSSMGLICTPSILYDLFGGRFLIFVPSSNLIVFIWVVNRLMFALLIGFPYPHRAPVTSHLEISIYSPVYLLKRCSLFIWICRFSRVPVVMLMSSA